MRAVTDAVTSEGPEQWKRYGAARAGERPAQISQHECLASSIDVAHLRQVTTRLRMMSARQGKKSNGGRDAADAAVQAIWRIAMQSRQRSRYRAVLGRRMYGVKSTCVAASHRRSASPTKVALQRTMSNEDVISADSSAAPAIPTFKRKKRPQAVRSSLLRGDTPGGDASDSSAREQTPLSGFEGDAEDSTRSARQPLDWTCVTTREGTLIKNCHTLAARPSRNFWRSAGSNGAPLDSNSIA